MSVEFRLNFFPVLNITLGTERIALRPYENYESLCKPVLWFTAISASLSAALQCAGVFVTVKKISRAVTVSLICCAIEIWMRHLSDTILTL